MLLQPTATKPSLNSHHQNHRHVSLSSTIHYSISFSSGLIKNSTFHLKQPIIPISKGNKVFLTCSSITRVQNYGRVDYRRRSMLKWNAVYQKISRLENQNMGSASVLNQVENEGKYLSKWELCRVVKELRRFRRYKLALEVYEWMNNRAEKYRITTSDTAIQLDLIAKVSGISSAEQYFLNLPDTMKDKRIYGALLNAYVQAKMGEKAECLMNKIRNRDYASHPLPFNVMMTLYLNLKEHEKIEPLILEMKEKNIKLDVYSYNIWLSSLGSQGSLEKMERVFDNMQRNATFDPNWTTFSTMATMYIKLEHFEKGENCLRKLESCIRGSGRIPYHYLISLYGSAGNKEEVYRIWNVYKASFVHILNLGYHTVISALVRLDDIDGAEKIFDEWLSVKSLYDPRIGNLLLGSYVRKGLSEKAKTFFDQMIQMGGKPNAMTFELLSEDHIRNGRIPEALSCLKNAASAVGSKSWKPKPTTVSSILNVSEQEADMAIKDALLEVLRQVGCFDDESYMSSIPISGGSTFTGSVPAVEDRAESDDEDSGGYVLLDQLHESL